MKPLILYFLLLCISSLVLIEIALLFPSDNKTEVHRLSTSGGKANHAKAPSAITHD